MHEGVRVIYKKKQPRKAAQKLIFYKRLLERFNSPNFKTKWKPVFNGQRWVWLKGSVYLGNLNTNAWPSAYATPKFLSDNSRKALFSCKVNRNNFHNITNFAHGVIGEQRVNPALEPIGENLAEGTNVTRLDGSGRFERSLQKYSALNNGQDFLYFTEKD